MSAPALVQLLSRQESEVNALIASFMTEYAASGRTASDAAKELPITCVRRIIKADNDSCTLSGDVPLFMLELVNKFIRVLTVIAWDLATKVDKRKTLHLRDLSSAVRASSRFDFLVDIIDILQQQSRTPHFNLDLSPLSGEEKQ